MQPHWFVQVVRIDRSDKIIKTPMPKTQTCALLLRSLSSGTRNLLWYSQHKAFLEGTREELPDFLLDQVRTIPHEVADTHDPQRPTMIRHPSTTINLDPCQVDR